MEISVNKQLNRIAEKKTGTNPQLDDMSEIVNYMTEYQSGTNPEKKTIGEALKEYADTMVIGGNVNTDDATALNSDLMQGKTAYARGNRLIGTYVPLDTSDATASADDIMDGYTAYVNGTKITGTHHDLDTSDATATAEDINLDKTAYVNGVKITGTHDRGLDGNFADSFEDLPIFSSKITTAITKIPDNLKLPTGYTSASYLFMNCTRITEAPMIDTTGITHYVNMFQNCKRLETAPDYDLHDAYELQGMFRGCTALANVPLYDTSNINTSAGFSNMFESCPNLTNQSLDNILQMCINATRYSSIGTKSLAELGIFVQEAIPSATYTEAQIRALPHYNDFVQAGWTIRS